VITIKEAKLPETNVGQLWGDMTTAAAKSRDANDGRCE
jgi:hypothetical protein